MAIRKIIFTKNWKKYASGDVFECKDKAAAKIVNEGFAKYFNDATDDIVSDIISKKTGKDKNDVLEEMQVNNIWRKNEKGKKELNLQGISKILRETYNIKTTGDTVKEIWFYENGIFKNSGRNKICHEIQKLSGGLIKNNQVNEIVKAIERTTTLFETWPEPPLNLICIKNGVFNLTTKTLLEHSPEFCFRTQLPIEYNPNATCSKIDDFLSQTLAPEDIETMLEYIAFGLYRKYFIKKAAIFVGEADTGKTTLLKVISALFGTSNCSAVSLHRMSSDKFSASFMFQKHVNIYDDLSYSDVEDVGVFKIATGTGWLPAEKKFGEQFQFLNFAKHIFATNRISAAKDGGDDAYYDRWLIFKFENTVLKKDHELVTKLTTNQEISGLFNKAVVRLDKLIKDGLFKYRYSVDENRLIMEEASSSLNSFVQKCLVSDPNGFISKEDFYSAYRQYSMDEQLETLTKTAVGNRLLTVSRIVYEGWQGKNKGWRGIKVIEVPKDTNATNTSKIVTSNIIQNSTNNTDILNISRIIKKSVGIVGKDLLLVDFVREADSGKGVYIEIILAKYSQEELDKALHQADIFENRRGYYKVLP